MREIVRVVDDRGGRLIVDEIYLGLSYEGEPRSVLALTDDVFVVSSFSKYFNMTGLAAGLDRRAAAARARSREARAEPLHLAGDGLAARGARLLPARHAGAARGAPAGVPRAARLPRARAARAGLSRARDAGRRLLRLRRLHALLARQPRLLPRRPRGHRRGVHARRRLRAPPRRRARALRLHGRAAAAARGHRAPRPRAAAAGRAEPRGRPDGPSQRERIQLQAPARWRSPWRCCRAAAWSTSTGRASPARSACWRARGRWTRCWPRPPTPGSPTGCSARARSASSPRRELGLPRNGSYTRYTDLGRPFVVWNVFAAPALSLEPREWCFPVAGCVSYRGYFDEADAKAEAARLAGLGFDVYVSGVPAYSTLGWFDDPLLSSFVRYPDTALARLVFHELAHQVVYVRDDSTFNESFATAVEEAGRGALDRRAGRHAGARRGCVAEQARSERLRARLQAPRARRRARSSRRSTRATRPTRPSGRARRRSSPTMRAGVRVGEGGRGGPRGLRPLVRRLRGARPEQREPRRHRRSTTTSCPPSACCSRTRAATCRPSMRASANWPACRGRSATRRSRSLRGAFAAGCTSRVSSIPGLGWPSSLRRCVVRAAQGHHAQANRSQRQPRRPVRAARRGHRVRDPRRARAPRDPPRAARHAARCSPRSRARRASRRSASRRW